MGVTGIEIQHRTEYAEGRAFGEAGAYDRIDGLIHYAVDPEHSANNMIVDLELAERGDDGKVHFTGDLCMLIPQDQRGARRRLFLELPNRGRRLIPRYLHRAKVEPAPGEIPEGDAFLLRHGFTVAWIGWQWDVLRSEALMGIEAPIALINGEPIAGQTICRFVPNTLTHAKLLADRIHHPYPAADLNDSDAVLTVRDSLIDDPQEIPRSDWQFARVNEGEIVPDPDYVYLNGGFQPGRTYEIVYTTQHSPVVGAGLLALRDAGSFFRYSDSEQNPVAGRIDNAYGFGISQTGRMLRHYVYLGMNVDEDGRQVYDGLLPHVGGARRGEFNHRFGQPSVQNTPGFGHRFPFADEDIQDPFTGVTDGLLRQQRTSGSMPKIFWTNSSAEYWRGDSALLHIDPTGRHDLPDAPETRVYSYAGTQHDPGVVPLVDLNANTGDRGLNGFNAIDYSPLLRSAVILLDEWATHGTAPPPSAHPRVDNGTAVTYGDVLKNLKTIPAITIPDVERLRFIRAIDLGPDAEKGIGRFPAVEGNIYPALVSAVDADGNEVAGIRLPDLTVPIGTFTPWNPRHPETGSPEQILPMRGSTFFFAKTAEERDETQDPRASIAERYGNREIYLTAVRVAATELVNQGYLLSEEIDTVLADAAERYDYVMKQGTI